MAEKNKKATLNFAVTAAIAVAALLVFFVFNWPAAQKAPVPAGERAVSSQAPSREPERATATVASPARPSEDVVDEPSAKPEVDSEPPLQELPEDMKRALAAPPPELPEDLKAQLESPPPELPPDLQAQLNSPPPELPPDLKAQLEAPPPEIPEDIKKALETPPRVVTLEEVNTPPAE